MSGFRYSLLAAMLVAVSLTGCARVLTRTYQIEVDGVRYEVRVYTYQGWNPTLEYENFLVVVIDGIEYRCNPAPTDEPDCEQVVRDYLAYAETGTGTPPLTLAQYNARQRIVPEEGGDTITPGY